MTIEIPQQTITEEFVKCWQTAGMHLERQSDLPLSWIKASLDGLLMEHFSFRLGNQIIFIQLEDVDGNLEYPSQRVAFLEKAEAWQGVPCIMPMKKVGREWQAMLPDWGLQHAITNELIIPPALITDEAIEITDYELQDFAIQIVRDKLKADGKAITSTQSDPLVNPSIWFVDSGNSSWVIVRAARYPKMTATPPANIGELGTRMLAAGHIGYFASVTVANAADPFDPAAEKTGNYLPLIRGVGYMCSYNGLEPVSALTKN